LILLPFGIFPLFSFSFSCILQVKDPFTPQYCIGLAVWRTAQDASFLSFCSPIATTLRSFDRRPPTHRCALPRPTLDTRLPWLHRLPEGGGSLTARPSWPRLPQARVVSPWLRPARPRAVVAWSSQSFLHSDEPIQMSTSDPTLAAWASSGGWRGALRRAQSTTTSVVRALSQ